MLLFAHNYKDSILYVCGNPSGAMSILYTDNPKRGDWKAVPSVLHDLQDPALFIDDDERAYMYWGSSNRWPIRGKELDMKNKFLPIAKSRIHCSFSVLTFMGGNVLAKIIPVTSSHSSRVRG